MCFLSPVPFYVAMNTQTGAYGVVLFCVLFNEVFGVETIVSRYRTARIWKEAVLALTR
jgi:hypothetical protein